MAYAQRTYWTTELVEKTIRDCMEALSIVRMPTGTELFRLGRNDLHCKYAEPCNHPQ